MMILRSSPASPFARKVRIAIILLGLDHSVRIEPADTTNPNDTLRIQNPLGKIPILVPESGPPLFDSRVIVEYLDHIAGGGRIIPKDTAARFAALRLQVLGDGIADAAILRVYENRYRAPERQEPKWLDHQIGKMARALDSLEADPPGVDQPIPNVGQIALACTLSYLDLRFSGSWRDNHPRLVAWLDAFAGQVPAYGATKPPA